MKNPFLLIAISCCSFFFSLTAFTPQIESGIVQDVFNQTNQFRHSKGLNLLIMRQELNEIAQQHSVNMANGRVDFGHDGFDKRNQMAIRAIHSLTSFAENVAYGPTSGKQVVNMWKNSSGHRRNMLGHYKYIGIGIAKDREGRIFYTEVFGG